jgi:signal peptidase I
MVLPARRTNPPCRRPARIARRSPIVARVNNPQPWSPDPSLAAIYGATLQWPAMLYLGRPLLALAWLVLPLAGIVVALYTLPPETILRYARVVPLLPAAGCGLHAFLLAKRTPPLARRPDFSQWYVLLGAWGLVVFILLRVAVVEPFRIPSTAMHPTLPAGSFVLVRKLGYGSYGTYGVDLGRSAPLVTPERGDIIVFEYPKNPEIDYIKRVVGLPGDRIEYRAGRLYLNGEAAPLEELRDEGGKVVYRETLGTARHEIALNRTRSLDMGNGSWVVPDDSYFVSGDNRDNSEDSRYWGFVPADAIVGELHSVLWRGSGAPR